MFGLVRPSQSLSRPAQELQRWDPWSDMERMRRDMDEVVTRAFGFTPLGRLYPETATRAVLPVEFWETDEQYQLRAHLPGIAREDINLETTANKVALWGERRAQTPENAKVHLSTATYGGFRFEYELPLEIKPEDVKATYRDGILDVVLPKIEAPQAKSVKVNIEG
jgi:HSP20 family protein